MDLTQHSPDPRSILAHQVRKVYTAATQLTQPRASARERKQWPPLAHYAHRDRSAAPRTHQLPRWVEDPSCSSRVARPARGPRAAARIHGAHCSWTFGSGARHRPMARAAGAWLCRPASSAHCEWFGSGARRRSDVDGCTTALGCQPRVASAAAADTGRASLLRPRGVSAASTFVWCQRDAPCAYAAPGKWP